MCPSPSPSLQSARTLHSCCTVVQSVQGSGAGTTSASPTLRCAMAKASTLRRSPRLCGAFLAARHAAGRRQRQPAARGGCPLSRSCEAGRGGAVNKGPLLSILCSRQRNGRGSAGRVLWCCAEGRGQARGEGRGARGEGRGARGEGRGARGEGRRGAWARLMRRNSTVVRLLATSKAWTQRATGCMHSGAHNSARRVLRVAG